MGGMACIRGEELVGGGARGGRENLWRKMGIR